MNKNDIQLLYEYDRWANNRVLHSVSVLSPEQFTRDLGGSFRSVRDTLVHIIGGEWGWLTYWKEPSPNAAFLKDLWDRHDVLFRPGAFPDLGAVRRKWAEIQKRADGIRGFANRGRAGEIGSCPRHARSFGASDATSRQPFYVS
jgi:DinB family